MASHTLDIISGYSVSTLAFVSDVNWMAVGAAVLLCARLFQDIPAAYEVIKKYAAKRKKKHDRQKSD